MKIRLISTIWSWIQLIIRLEKRGGFPILLSTMPIWSSKFLFFAKLFFLREYISPMPKNGKDGTGFSYCI
jgi:hypothetical protein